MTDEVDLAPGQSKAEPRQHWPAHVRPISYGGLGMLGVDADSRLYWDGKPVKTERHLRLTNIQTAIALVTATAALIGAFAALVPAVTGSIDFGCKRSWWVSPCERVSK